ncbi:MAG TPA: hypothetical protein VJT49_14000 [Amycolatopsis sp.]|uniref:hypothetical protein n=1 Tax=Amycolatopsis sp. TaxID=37632 RepID=UPI002B4941D1|nr:hypothetical protein [Amycolatopsis sp.]HKS46195.1 hypothetical protein [Amycolatopsis sp.]
MSTAVGPIETAELEEQDDLSVIECTELKVGMGYHAYSYIEFARPSDLDSDDR